MLNLNGMLSIVMPAYNEEKLIYHSIMETLRIVEKFVPELEIIAVNDGSKDNSAAIVAQFTDTRIHLIPLLYKQTPPFLHKKRIILKNDILSIS